MANEDRALDQLRSDAEHLADLVSMLPGTDIRLGQDEFWRNLEVALGIGPPGAVRDHLSDIERSLRRLEPSSTGPILRKELQDIVQPLLRFFDRDDNEAVFELLGRTLRYPIYFYSRAGRRWVNDATATAWRLYVPGYADFRRDQDQTQLGPDE